MDQFHLIERKNQTRGQIERTQRELTHLRLQASATRPTRAQQRKIAKLETRLELLMAQEYNLRLAIDRKRG